MDPEGSWDDAMKRTVNHADYRALQTLGDRKAAFERWGRERREAAEAAARAEERRRKVQLVHGCCSEEDRRAGACARLLGTPSP